MRADDRRAALLDVAVFPCVLIAAALLTMTVCAVLNGDPTPIRITRHLIRVLLSPIPIRNPPRVRQRVVFGNLNRNWTQRWKRPGEPIPIKLSWWGRLIGRSKWTPFVIPLCEDEPDLSSHVNPRPHQLVPLSEAPRPRRWNENETVGAIAVELRVWPPLIASLDLSHNALPRFIAFHIFHTNFSHDKASEYWFKRGAMSKAIRFWRRHGRRVLLHPYQDRWHWFTTKYKTRPSNTYPRMREFWTDYFHEDKIITLQSDTGFCPSSPHSLDQFLHQDFSGATWGSPLFKVGKAGQGGLSIRNRHAMYKCLDFVSDARQQKNHKSALWDFKQIRNEDFMMVTCMRNTAERADGVLERCEARDCPTRETRPRYHSASVCIASKWSQEAAAIDAVIKNEPPPFGFHDICRSIRAYGKCEDTSTTHAGERPGQPPVVREMKCDREDFSVDRAFNAWEQYCGANLVYQRSCTDHPSNVRQRGENRSGVLSSQ